MKIGDSQESNFGWFNNNTQQYKEATVKHEQKPFDIFNMFASTDKITINAGAGDDKIKVSKTGDDEYTVNINGEEYKLSKAEMENLTINGGDGNDSIVIDPSVDVGITVKGGAGDDNIFACASGSVIDGGSGNDSIAALGHDNTVLGGEGDDKIVSIGDNNQVNGGTNDFFRDLFFGGGGSDQVFSIGQQKQDQWPFGNAFMFSKPTPTSSDE